MNLEREANVRAHTGLCALGRSLMFSKSSERPMENVKEWSILSAGGTVSERQE